ncbi:hypothetical protein BASA84_000274 [Batrachochytrium salamandrivorans]|nr:hypothetical protein BASA84_000274 [Batrachochytrium salamandrivorans]
MQFFHLVPFVVVASYAAALPQPAELSEKYLNNVNLPTINKLEMVLLVFTRTETEAGQKITGNAGDLLTKYLRRASYVNACCEKLWVTNFVPDIREAIKDGLGDANTPRSFKSTVYIRLSFIWGLKSLLDTFTAGETLSGYLDDISESIDEFAAGQNELFFEIMEEYEAASSQE